MHVNTIQFNSIQFNSIQFNSIQRVKHGYRLVGSILSKKTKMDSG